MGLNKNSTGLKAVDLGLVIKKAHDSDRVVALGGNPNVGKSTVFNELTGLRQHTGNWPGKTVTNAQGNCTYKDIGYVFVDLPGCYSLMAHSTEEEVARDFICFGGADAVVIVCDATCLERGMNLVLQTMEITQNVIVCVNLLDEAKKKKIKIDLQTISKKLGVPVIGTAARSKKGLDDLMDAVAQTIQGSNRPPVQIQYPDYIETAISNMEPHIKEICGGNMDSRWLSLMLLHGDQDIPGSSLLTNESIKQTLDGAKKEFTSRGMTERHIKDDIVTSIIYTAEEICKDTVIFENKDYKDKDSKIDRILTGKWTAFPIMILALMGVFWLTITGANYPSQVISDFLFWIEDQLLNFFKWINAPRFLYEMLVLGVYRVLAWVVSVMLPPMAIFFPLFTLLEDVGFLPRIAFNLDKCFKKCCACGKQALTMCMGFGCNAAGVIGCRIIDSPRERLIAIITNNFVPCNGRYPALIAIISMFFAGSAVGGGASVLSAALLTVVIVLGVFMTFVISKFLSKTVLKGEPSSFTLELPPYRKPQIGKVIIRSVFDRTLFVLGRAVLVAAPAGLVIWIMANVYIGDMTLLAHCSGFLDPFARFIGLDGVILLAFILGFPANEIVIPIIIMAYMAKGSILELDNLSVLKQLLEDNGWTWITAISVMLFSLMHWPCSTTILTIKKETQSLKWTIISVLVPTVTGIGVCFVFTAAARLISGT